MVDLAHSRRTRAGSARLLTLLGVLLLGLPTACRATSPDTSDPDADVSEAPTAPADPRPAEASDPSATPDPSDPSVTRPDPEDVAPPRDSRPPRPAGVEVEPMRNVSVRAGVEMELWADFREEAAYVQEFAVTVLNELLVRTHAGDVLDVSNRTVLYGGPAQVRQFAVEPGSDAVWCQLADRLTLLDPRTGELADYLSLEGGAERRIRFDALGRMYLFGPDEPAEDGSARWALTLFDADGAYVKLVTLDEEIRDVAPSIATNRIYFATRANVFVVEPPRAPEHVTSLGAAAGGSEIVALCADEPSGLLIGTPDAVLWMSTAGTLTPITTGVGGQVELAEGGIAVFDRARQVVLRLRGLDHVLTRDRIRARAAEELRQGLLAFAQNNFYRAAVHLNRGLHVFPSATRVLYPLAAARLQLGDARGARSAYERFAEAHPELVLALPDLYEPIREATDDATATRPSVHFNLGYAELREANWRSAAREFESSLFHNPDNTPAYYNLAIAQLNLGLAGDAADNLRAYLDQRREAGDSRDVQWSHAEELLQLLGDPNAVESLLRAEREAFEGASRRVDEAGEDFERGRQAYRAFLERFSDGVYVPFARDRLNRLDAFERQKRDLDRIEAELETMRQAAAEPGDDQAERRARYYTELALRFSEFVHRHPNSIYLDYLIGRLGEARLSARQQLLDLAASLYAQRHFETAAMIYSRLLEWFPEAHDLRFNLAQVYRRAGRWEEAAAQYRAYAPHAAPEEREAIEQLLPAIERRAQAERLLFVEFEAAQSRGELMTMREILVRALAIDDQYWMAHYYMAITLQHLATPDARRMYPDLPSERESMVQAIVHLTIALRLEPRPFMLRTRAGLRANMREFEAAAADYSILIAHREDPADLQARAECYRRLGRDADAIRDLRRVIELRPELRPDLEAQIRMIERDSE